MDQGWWNNAPHRREQRAQQWSHAVTKDVSGNRIWQPMVMRDAACRTTLQIWKPGKGEVTKCLAFKPSYCPKRAKDSFLSN